ncbi:MAG: twin-arginine translocation signal domain-containing protein, partial [Thermoguttaceae bacterium]|nr:twin-arginine translocation signal domain-containing protein [Thermoguttaceae bacterium]
MSNWSRRDFLRTGALTAVSLSGGAVVLADEAADRRPADGGALLSCVTFKLDVTPDIGATMAYSIHREKKNSIYIRGAVFDDGEKRVVWAACDYLFICGETYLAWREKIAEAAGTEPLNVFLHSIHTHESMWIAPEFNPGPNDDWRKVSDQEYCDKTIAELAALIAEK